MNDLARHLIESGSHGGLSFNPACPACREERLTGALTRLPLVPARAQAGLAAALLAASGAAPTAALANPGQEAESEQPGAAAPGGAPPSISEGGDPSTSSGADTPLGEQPLAVAPPGDGPPGADEPGGIEAPDTGDDDDDGEPAAGPGPAGTPGEPSRGDGDEPGGIGEGAVSDRRPSRGVQSDELPRERPAKTRIKRDAGDRTQRESRRGGAPGARGGPQRTAPAGAPAVRGPFAGAPATTPGAGVRPTAPVPAATASASSAAGHGLAASTCDQAARSHRLHVVRAGESLWSIARDLVGHGATTAAVAREVQRIWDLNAAAIGTGDPDLVLVGQTLRLR